MRGNNSRKKKIFLQVSSMKIYLHSPVSPIHGLLLAFAGTIALSTSVAEMVKMRPIVGVRCQWISMLAPSRGCEVVILTLMAS